MFNTKKITNHYSAFSLCMILLLPAVHASAAGKQPAEQPWVMEMKGPGVLPEAQKEVAKLVVFRKEAPGEAAAKNTLNIYIDGRYHASLYPARQAAELALCPGRKSLAIEESNGDGHIHRLNRKTASADLAAGSLHYYRVGQNSDGSVTGEWVDNSEAEQIITQLPIQTHTLSRVPAATNCPTEIIRLNTATLFAFNRADAAGLLQNGQQTLQKTIDSLNENYTRIDHIRVVGYTDPLGSYQYNMNLSAQRANTIARALGDAGIDRSLITARGLGPGNLLIDDCDKKNISRQAIIKCNQPNRRVEIEVFGVHK